jgi:hypothetical protein
MLSPVRRCLVLSVWLYTQSWGLLGANTITHAKELTLPKSQTVLNTDIDGDGKSDRVVASYYTQPVLTRKFPSLNTCQTLPGIFVRYTLTSSKTKQSRVIFEYSYGTSLVRYWVHELKVAGDLDRNDLQDLIFYAGDDTSDESVVLFQQQAGFKAVYLGIYDIPGFKFAANNDLVSSVDSKNILSYWQPQALAWKGNGSGWITGDCAIVRQQPRVGATAMLALFKNDIVEIVEDRLNVGWVSVKTYDGKTGWIDRKYISRTTVARWFR